MNRECFVVDNASVHEQPSGGGEGQKASSFSPRLLFNER